jgi:Ca2+-binding RTX toxin-like protein
MPTTAIAAYFQMPVASPRITGAYGVAGALPNNPNTTYDERLLVHLGIDIGGTTSTSIGATANGKVVGTGLSNSAFGKYVVLEHLLSDGTKVYSLYGHMSSVSVSLGQDVLMGAKVGTMGGSGGANPNMYATHLHFEISTKNLFIGSGQYAGGYDTPQEFSTTKNYTVNPSTFISNRPINNVQNGTSSADLISGIASSERLDGKSGDDEIRGNGGADVIIGGSGRDVMYGGTGADVFDFNFISESRVGSLFRDVIMDFERGVDDIDLRTIDASTRVTGDQAFSYIGTSSFGGVAGQLRMTGGVISGDTNGDRVADFEISVRGAIESINTLSSSDFFL